MSLNSGEQATQELLSGQLQFTFSNYVTTILTASAGAQLRVVADGAQTLPNTNDLMVARDSPINSVAQLRGKTIAVNAIGNALFCFAKYPAAWNDVRDDPSRARAAFDEAMRFESPVQTFFRTTTRAVDVSGVAIPEGEKVLMFLAAANRDPRRWESPDTFDVHRRTGGHVGFGAGIHRCVGEAIARLEGTALIAALARRVASIELAGEPVQRLNNTLRGFESLPLAVRAPKSAPA